MICIKCNKVTSFETLKAEKRWIDNNGSLCYYCSITSDINA
jgi:hypothetical protein